MLQNVKCEVVMWCNYIGPVSLIADFLCQPYIPLFNLKHLLVTSLFVGDNGVHSVV